MSKAIAELLVSKENLALESTDPIIFPPLLHNIRQAELQVKRATLLTQAAEDCDELLDEDKADIHDSLQSALGAKSDAQRAFQTFLGTISKAQAQRYLSIAAKLQSSRKRSIAIRRWERQGIILETDPCYRSISARSEEYRKHARRAASLLALIEQKAESKQNPTAPSDPLETVRESKKAEEDDDEEVL